MSLSVYILFVHGKVKYLAPFQIHIAFVFLLKMICLSPKKNYTNDIYYMDTFQPIKIESFFICVYQ